MRPNRFVRLAVALLAPLLVAGVVVTQAGAALADGGHGSHVLYVSASAKHWNSDRSCRSAAFKTIQSAVNAAPAGGTVVVCPGTYHEQVVISKPLTLTGKQATIDEKGVTPTFSVTLPPPTGTQTIYAAVVMTSSKIKFTGFRVQNAQGEGILAAGLGGTVSGIVISGNTVVHNDLGGPTAPTYFECLGTGAVPGDCGEGVHFAGNVAYSTIRDNFIAHNSGGVLLSDDVGPTHNNVVQGNVVTDNLSDCGITVPGHNPMGVNAAGVPQPSVAGVYRNAILDNVVTGNGVVGEGGAGVLFANAQPGTASYDNLVQGNYIAGNGLSGVTMHAHGPASNEDLNGNVIVDNSIGKNNVLGDPLDGVPGTAVTKTTGVLVFSGGTSVTVTIAHNHIFNNFFGIWLSKPVTALGLHTNSFSHVVKPISAGH